MARERSAILGKFETSDVVGVSTESAEPVSFTPIKQFDVMLTVGNGDPMAVVGDRQVRDESFDGVAVPGIKFAQACFRQVQFTVGSQSSIGTPRVRSQRIKLPDHEPITNHRPFGDVAHEAADVNFGRTTGAGSRYCRSSSRITPLPSTAASVFPSVDTISFEGASPTRSPVGQRVPDHESSTSIVPPNAAAMIARLSDVNATDQSSKCPDKFEPSGRPPQSCLPVSTFHILAAAFGRANRLSAAATRNYVAPQSTLQILAQNVTCGGRRYVPYETTAANGTKIAVGKNLPQSRSYSLGASCTAGTQCGESGECVALPKALCGCPQTSKWKKGRHVTASNLPMGTAIARFGSSGAYLNDGTCHATILIGLRSDGSIDCWSQNWPAGTQCITRHTISKTSSGSVTDAAAYYEIVTE